MADFEAPTSALPSTNLSAPNLTWASNALKNFVPTPIRTLTHNPRLKEAVNAARAAMSHPARAIVATQSFEDAVVACKEKVAKISKECRRFNRKYRDAHFGRSPGLGVGWRDMLTGRKIWRSMRSSV